MKRKEFAILGAGRLAHSLAPALMEAGAAISCIYSRSPRKAAQFAKQFSIAYKVSALEKVPASVTHILVPVADPALPEIAHALAKGLPDVQGKTFIHFSGALTSSVFSELEGRGAACCSLHILQSFPTKTAVPLANCAAACEANSAKGSREAVALAKLLGLRPFKIAAGHKALYHVMGVVLSNFLTGNLAFAEELFHACRIKGIPFRQLAEPIIQRTLANAWEQGIDASLSGPVERNDRNLLEMHLQALASDEALSGLLASYKTQGAALIKIAKRKNKTLDYSRLEKLLKR